MNYLIVKQKVEDFETWYTIFKSHEEAQKEAGLSNAQIFKDHVDLQTVVCMFQVNDVEKAKAFTQAPDVDQAQEESGMIGKPEILFLKEI